MGSFQLKLKINKNQNLNDLEVNYEVSFKRLIHRGGLNSFQMWEHEKLGTNNNNII